MDTGKSLQHRKLAGSSGEHKPHCCAVHSAPQVALPPRWECHRSASAQLGALKAVGGTQMRGPSAPCNQFQVYGGAGGTRMPRVMTSWIRLVATEQDKRLLRAISRRNGDAGFSATVRRLIREEALRLGIVEPEPLLQDALPRDR